MFDLDQLFQKSELIPVIIQDDQTLEVLMLASPTGRRWS